ncbi:MAG: exopolyphosphatase [Acidobacteriota bacterium]
MLAAVDLGSNSFRLLIARVDGEQPRPVDRLREGVRLAAFLDADNRLSYEGQHRALEALARFGQRLRDFPAGSVRAVGTNTLRKARNADDFLQEAQRALGHPIEVVSGLEEARLIFLGVANSLGRVQPAAGIERRLVIDIGGGSTEVIVGEALEPEAAESMYMGCVSYTLTHFRNGRITSKRMKKAVTAARLELRTHAKQLKSLGWDRAIGASGTIQAISEILIASDWNDRVGGSATITLDGLRRLRAEVEATPHVEALDLPGLRRERARVLPGGLAILIALFEGLDLEQLAVSPGAMREGLLFDLLGRLRHEDARDRTIEHLIDFYRLDRQQGLRVQRTALDALEQVAADWTIDPIVGGSFLSWAARLHEIGLAVAHAGHHKHGAYLLQHSALSGFSLQDQRILALLVGGHRRKLRPPQFRELLPKRRAKRTLRLCVLLRLACLLNRSRSSRALPEVRYRARGKTLRVTFPDGWLIRHPLTRADLEQETAALEAAGFRLRIESRAEEA